MVAQAQAAMPRLTRLFLRQLQASHLGSELEGESWRQLGDCRSPGRRCCLPLCHRHSLPIPEWLPVLDLSFLKFLVHHRPWGTVLCS